MKTKTHLGKKVLSVILSALMVVTMLPTFAITSSAATVWTPVASSDFAHASNVADNAEITTPVLIDGTKPMNWTTGVWTGNGSATKEDDALYIPDGFLRLSGYDNARTATPLTGLSTFKMDLGFRFKSATNSNNVTADNTYFLYKFYVYNTLYGNISKDDNPNPYEFCALAQDAHGKILSWNSSGVYGTSDSTNHSTAIATSSSNLSAGVNYHYICEYNGHSFKAYITNDSGTVVENIINTTDSDLLDHLATGLNDGIKSIYLGAHRGDGDMWMRDIEYRNIVFYTNTGTDAYSHTDVVAMQDAMYDFETMLNSGDIYTNMAAAYNAYLDCSELHDAYMYGGGTTSGFSAATASLEAAMNNMHKFNAAYYKANQSVTWYNTDGTTNMAGTGSYVNGNAYSNVLYATSVLDNYASPTRFHSIAVRPFAPKTVVWLYDGTNALWSPICFIDNENGTGSRQIRAAYYSTVAGTSKATSNPPTARTDLTFVDWWHVKDEKWGTNNRISWSVGWDGTANKVPSFRNTDTNQRGSSMYGGNDKWSVNSNVVVYSDGDFSAYGKTIEEPNLYFGDDDSYTNCVYEDQAYKIVNYKYYYQQVKAKYDAKIASFTGGRLREGEALTLFTAVDAATSLDPNSSTYCNNGASDAYSTIISDMATKVSDINSCAALSDDTEYNTLRSYLTDGLNTKSWSAYGNNLTAKTIYEDSRFNATTVSNYAAFATAYENAVAHMAALPTSGYGHTASPSGKTVSQLSSELSDAYDALATRSTAAVPTFSGETYLGPSDSMTVASSESGIAGTVTYKVFYDGKSTTSTPDDSGTFSYNSSTNLTLFGSGNHTSAVVTAYGTDVNGNTDTQTSTTYRYFNAPTANRASNTELVSGSTDTITVTKSTCGANGDIKYQIKPLAPSAGDYGATQSYSGAFNPFTNGNTKVSVKIWEEKSGSTSDVLEIENLVLKPGDPTIDVATDSYLDENDLITITGDTGATVTYNDELTEGGTSFDTNDQEYSAPFAPFAGKDNTSGAATYTITPYSTRNGSTSDGATTYTYHYLSTPTINKSADNELAQTDVVTVTRTSGGSGTLQYSLSRDNSSWSEWADCSGTTFAPFNVTGYTSDLILYVKVREHISASTNSPASTAVRLLKKVDTYTMYWVADSDTLHSDPSTSTYAANGSFYISDTITSSYSGKTVYYQATADGVAGSFNSYNINNGIDSDTYADNEVVTFRFYVISGGTTSVVATGTFYKEGLDTLIYHETFDGSVSGSTYTARDAKGVNINLGSAGSVVSAAGDKNGTAATWGKGKGSGDGTGDGSSQDWRHNVLKIEPSASDVANTTEASYVKLASNPFATAVNKARLPKTGATISFWRANEHSDKAVQKSIGFKESSETADYARNTQRQNWRNAIAFRKGGTETGTAGQYYMVEMVGINSFVTQGGDGGNYIDIDPYNQDVTTTSASSVSGYWEHIAITINPNASTLNDAIIVYLNGVPHTTTVTPHGIYSSGTDAEKVQTSVAAMMDFITDSDTYVCLGHDNTWDITTDNIFFDDIRVYADVLTQKEIWETYYDEVSDTPKLENKQFSVTHDPTNVTVYKLTEAVSGVAANSLVGQEFIDYHHLTSSQYTIDSYYSFGTGMVVYKSTDNKNWNIIGDSAGRVGYQNQDLFGSEYHTALSEALAEIDALMTDPAAGNLVWAPHVMYNVSTNKWMMYVAISCWGDCQSTIIAMESADGTLEHFKARNGASRAYSFVVKSTSRPNAIDACPFYGHDASGNITPGTLYMTYGAWSEGNGGTEDICVMQLDSTGMYNNGNANVESGIVSYANCYNAGSGTRIASSQPEDSTGEGSFVVYKSNAELGLTAETGSSTGGYYYLYASYGHNDNEYNIRVYRSESPTSAFEDMGNTAATSTSATHGASFMRPFFNDKCDYIYMSTGHNSIYEVVNDNGETITLNATHARPMSNDDNGWKAIPDAAMATRQRDLSGNVTFINPVFYTQSGWPVPMPQMYDGSDTTLYVGSKNKKAGSRTYTATDIEGVYTGNIVDSYDGDYAINHTFNVVATDTDKGTIVNNYTMKGYPFELAYGTYEGVEITYINLYNSGRTSKIAEGVIANHAGKPEFSIVHYDGRHTWGAWQKVYPRDVTNPEGEVNVEMDKVIYTHKANDDYSKYGQEISDNEAYLTTGADERVTTIEVQAPYYIDANDPNAIVAMNDAEFAAQGYTSGKYKAEFVKAVKENGTAYTDEADYLANRATAGGSVTYKLTGSVSTYFAYRDGKYQETGLELLIQYTDGTNSYGEYKFPYVTFNPGWAHTMAATQNTNSDTGNNRNSSYGTFNRFIGSYGKATPTYSHLLYDAANGSTSATGYGNGSSKYVSNFETLTDSTEGVTFNTLDGIKATFVTSADDVGVNAGSYSAISHDNDAPNAYTATPDLVDVNYYIDYSDTNNYIQNNPLLGVITLDSETGKPDGYRFKMKTSNFLWANYSGASIFNISSYAMNNTGLNVSYSSTGDDGTGLVSYDTATAQGNVSLTGNMYTNFDSFRSDVTWEGKRTFYEEEMLFHTDQRNNSNSLFTWNYRNQLLYYFSSGSNYATASCRIGSDSDEGYLDGTGQNGTAPTYYNFKNNKAYTTGSNGKNGTNQWQGVATFTGRGSVIPNTYSKTTKGYWYKHKVDNHTKMDYTTDRATASSAGDGNWGELDVSAETYANYILEMGNYHKVSDTGVDGGRFLGHETYHYYNIGVATCDKGAVRELVDTWGNKKMNIARDGNGKITTITGTGTGGAVEALNASDYTVASYNEYVNALAKAYWFINNPKNTTYTSSVDGKTYAYSTAYGTFGGATHASIYTEDEGNNIFGTATPADDAYSTDNKVHTDEVQAQIIADVIEAYENLFKVTDYTAAETSYDSVHFYSDTAATTEITDKSATTAGAVKAIQVGSDEAIAYNDYTEDSWANFVNLVKGVSEDFDFYTNDATEGGDKVDTDIDLWRYTPISGSEYKQLLAIMDNADSTLMPNLDTTDLDALIDEKTDDVQAGIFTREGGKQAYTFGSWDTIRARIPEATGLKSPEYDSQAKYRKEGAESDTYFEVGKYDVTGVTEYKFNDITYYAQDFNNTAFTKSTYTSATNCSAAQHAIYDELNLSGDTVVGAGSNTTVLGGMNLVEVDSESAYETYDGAKAVVDALDMDKYTAEGRSIITNAANTTYGNVYTTPTAAQVTAYYEATGKSITTSTKLRITTSGLTDPQSAELLSEVNRVNTTKVGGEGDDKNDYAFIKYFLVTFNPQASGDNGATLGNGMSEAETNKKVMYGDNVTLTLPAAYANKPVVKWSVSAYSGEYSDGISGDPISSQKLSGAQGDSITRIVTSNIAVTAEVDLDSGAVGDNIQYNILDCYGKLNEVKYSSATVPTSTESGKTVASVADVTTALGVTPKTIPYYTCAQWEVSLQSDKLITLKPLYTTNQTFEYNLVGATTERILGVDYDSKVTINFDTTKGTFAAWAVRVNRSTTETPVYRYQIASYSPNYMFYACANEEYVALVEGAGGTYVTTDATPVTITADKLDGAITETGTIGDNAFVNQKIHDKAPFVSVENLVMENTKVRLFVRITQGATEPTGYGVLMRKDYSGTDDNMIIGNGVTRRAVTSRLSTGQFTYTLNKSAGFTSGDAVSFRAFVNYDFNYTAANQGATINALDYSKTLKVQKS